MPKAANAVVPDELVSIRNLLAPVVNGLSRKHQAGFRRLYVLASVGHRAQPANGHVNGSHKNGKSNGHAAAPTATPMPTPIKKVSTAAQSRISSEAELARKDDMRMELLYARQTGEKAYETKHAEIVKRLQLPSWKNPVTVIGAIMAYTAGKFRPDFAARIVLRAAKGKPRVDAIRALAAVLGETYDHLHTKVKNSQTFRDGDN